METLKILKADPSMQTALDCEIIPDQINIDQLEINENEKKCQKYLFLFGNFFIFSVIIPKAKVPEGTSEYQASWLIDDDYEDECDEEKTDEDEFDGEEDNANTDNKYNKSQNDFCAPMEEQNLYENGEVDSHSVIESTTMDETIDLNDADVNDDQQKELFKKERENRQWPDEVEAPEGMNARDRFKRYRGLKSFRLIYFYINVTKLNFSVLERALGIQKKT